jgi:hypothetical protein
MEKRKEGNLKNGVYKLQRLKKCLKTRFKRSHEERLHEGVLKKTNYSKITRNKSICDSKVQIKPRWNSIQHGILQEMKEETWKKNQKTRNSKLDVKSP